MKRLMVIALLVLCAPALLGVPPKKTASRAANAPTTLTATEDEKAALSAVRAYQSVRETGDEDGMKRYFLEAKVKVDRLGATAIAEKIRDAFAPSDQARSEREVSELLGRVERFAPAARDSEKSLSDARARVESNRSRFVEYGPALDALHVKFGEALTAASEPEAMAVLLNAMSWQALENVGKERAASLAMDLSPAPSPAPKE